MLQLASFDFNEAVESLRRAVSAYEKWGFTQTAPTGAAYCLAELANAQFLASPENPDDAVRTLADAVNVAPDSQEGRAFTRNIHITKLVPYLLAAGQEDAARQQLADVLKTNDAETLAVNLSAAYAELAYQVMRRPDAMVPHSVTTWLRRAFELDPANARAHLLAGNLALRSGRCEDAVLAAQNAAQVGADPNSVLQFLLAVRQNLPECMGVLPLWDELSGGQPMPPLPEEQWAGPPDVPPAPVELEGPPAPPPDEQTPNSPAPGDDNPAGDGTASDQVLPDGNGRNDGNDGDPHAAGAPSPPGAGDG